MPHPRTPGRRDLVTIAVLLVLALAEALQVFVGLALQHTPVSWPQAVGATLPSWGVLILLVLPLLRVLDRLWVPPLRSRHLLVLAVGAALFSGLHLAGSALLAGWPPQSGVVFQAQFYRLATLYFVPDLLTFVAVVTLHAVLRWQDEGRRREVAEVSRRAEYAQARFQALSSQLRPDFFFNTLNAVAGLMVRGDTSRSLEVLSSLSALLRASLTLEPGRPVPLTDELELVAGYLAIQGSRFPDRLSVVWEITGAGHCSVPALVLVQLVEELVDRGVDAGTPFSLAVRARMREDRLEVDVEHSGPEIDLSVFACLADRVAAFEVPGRLTARRGSVSMTLPARSLATASRSPEMEMTT